MKNPLKIIQIFSKIAYIISLIVFVCCIVGAVGCVLGLITLPLGLNSSFEINGVTIKELISTKIEMSTDNLYVIISVSLILCIAEILSAWFASRYFKNELNAGTPFTKAGSKEIFRLGIITISVSIGATILSSIVQLILVLTTNANWTDYSFDFSILTSGILFLIFSVIFNYGAEILEKSKQNENSIESASIENVESQNADETNDLN